MTVIPRPRPGRRAGTDRHEEAMNLGKACLVAAADLAIVGELAAAIWWANQDPAQVFWRFIQVFAPAALLTMLACRLATRRFFPASAGDGDPAGGD